MTFYTAMVWVFSFIAVVLLVIGIATLVVARCRDLRISRRTYPHLVPSAPDSVRHIITLVHGTWPRGFWGKDIAWYSKESSLCQSLARPGTLIHRFTWSGANSVLARLEAATNLKREVSTLLSEYPSASHSIV